MDSRPSFCKPNNPPYHCFEGENQERRPVEGITFMDDMPGVKHNYSYFPIFFSF